MITLVKSKGIFIVYMISLSAFNHKPRQFEYHSSGSRVLYGTVDGACYVSDKQTQQVISLGRYGRTHQGTASIISLNFTFF